MHKICIPEKTLIQIATDDTYQHHNNKTYLFVILLDTF